MSAAPVAITDCINLVRSLIDVVPDAMVVVGADLRVLAANQPAYTYLPMLRIDDPLHKVLRAPDVLDAVSRVFDTQKCETVVWRERVPVERSFDVKIAPLDVEGFGPTIVLSLRDLTEALKVEKMRSTFIANVSHELRTPLASMLGFIETLQGPARDDPNARARFLDIMRTQGRRMARLIDDLLSLSRIEQNAHMRPNESVDLVLIVHHVIDTLTPMARDAHIEIALSAPPKLVIAGERDEMMRVVENLIENAIKYGSSDDGTVARVDVTLAQDGQDALLSVRDYGAGIAPEHLPRLTERFYRVDAGASRAKGGTGLGLAIVKHIVAHHRGRLSIESKPQQGALFRITLPLYSEPH
jgi:two-component system, OmpR family, phosphate regulon sensor histidine kinase PhoR